MHGVFFHFFKEYMEERYGGKETWESLLIANGCAYKVYFTVKEYPDEDLISLMVQASNLLDIPFAEMVGDYGRFLAPRMLRFYSTYIKDPNWKSLELMANVGQGIHHTIRTRNPDTSPPEIMTERLSQHQLRLRYSSPRRLCVLLEGMIRGVGDYYGEELHLSETECVHHGGGECVFEIERLSTAN